MPPRGWFDWIVPKCRPAGGTYLRGKRHTRHGLPRDGPLRRRRLRPAVVALAATLVVAAVALAAGLVVALTGGDQRRGPVGRACGRVRAGVRERGGTATVETPTTAVMIHLRNQSCCTLRSWRNPKSLVGPRPTVATTNGGAGGIIPE